MKISTLTASTIICLGFILGIFIFINALNNKPIAAYEINSMGITQVTIDHPGGYLLKKPKQENQKPEIKGLTTVPETTIIFAEKDHTFALAKIDFMTPGKYSIHVESNDQ